MDQEVNIIRIENWKRLILEANNSGLSKTEWCRQNNISRKTFFYWQRKVRLMEAQKALSSSELPSVSTGQKTAISSDFVDMTHLYKETTAPTESVPSGNSQSGFAPQLMLLADQYRILIGEDVREQTLSTVLRAIKHA